MTAALLLPVYLLALAVFLLVVNIKTGETWLKVASIAGMLAAAAGSAAAALVVYR